MKTTVKQWMWSSVFFLLSASSYADNLFATGWGRTFDASAEGRLFFTAMEVFGIFTCMKSLTMVYRYANNKGKHGYWTCCTIFLSGCLMYFMHATFNLIYNSF